MRTLAVLAFLLLVAGCQAAPLPELTVADRAAIDQLTADYMAAARAADWDAWTELWTTDVPRATAFYRDLAQWERTTAEEAVLEDYVLFQSEERPRAGLIEIEWEGVRPHWLPYIRVQDPGVIAARVESLGGRVLLEPSANIRGGSVGLILDPSGAVFAIQQWPVQQGGGS